MFAVHAADAASVRGEAVPGRKSHFNGNGK